METQNQIKYSKSRQRIIRNIGIGFVIVMIVLTYLSKTINNLLLPRVMYIEPSSGTIVKEQKVAGEIVFDDYKQLVAAGDWELVDIKVHEGDMVKKGDVLAVFDASEVQLAIERAELEIRTLDNEIEELVMANNNLENTGQDEEAYALKKAVEKAEEELAQLKKLYEIDSRAKESVEDAEERLSNAKRQYEYYLSQQKKQAINDESLTKRREIEIENKKLERKSKSKALSELKEVIKNNGDYVSPIDGSVKSILAKKGQKCSKGMPIIELMPSGTVMSVQWLLNASKASEVDVGDSVKVIASEPETIELEGMVESKIYSSEAGMYKLKTSFPENEYNLAAGQRVDVVISKRSGNYGIVLPSSCIYEAEGKKIVYIIKEKEGVFGKEHYVEQVFVKVEDTNDIYTAVSGNISGSSKIVLFTSKPLMDGVQVKLNE